jgi:hypothetical protein
MFNGVQVPAARASPMIDAERKAVKLPPAQSEVATTRNEGTRSQDDKPGRPHTLRHSGHGLRRGDPRAEGGDRDQREQRGHPAACGAARGSRLSALSARRAVNSVVIPAPPTRYGPTASISP